MEISQNICSVAQNSHEENILRLQLRNLLRQLKRTQKIFVGMQTVAQCIGKRRGVLWERAT